MPNGSRYWRLKYRFAGKEKRLSFGVYPETILSDAREQRERKLLAAGSDPGFARREFERRLVSNSANSFELVAREWHANNLEKWTLSYGEDILHRLEADIFPQIGARPVSNIAPIQLPDALHLQRQIFQSCVKQLSTGSALAICRG